MSRILKDKKELALGDRRKTFQEPGQGRANTDARENKATRSVSWAYGCGVRCAISLSLTIFESFLYLFPIGFPSSYSQFVQNKAHFK